MDSSRVHFFVIYLYVMVTIKKGILNRVGFSVKELANCEDPMEFTFRFTSENSEGIVQEITMSPVNLGSRLQVFEITEGTDVIFDLEGYYSYEIRQTAQNNLVEVGLVRVEGEDENNPTFTTSKNTQVYGATN